jgi:hypothetical protein
VTTAHFSTLQTLARGGKLAFDGTLTDALSGFERVLRRTTIDALCQLGYLQASTFTLTPAGREAVARVTRPLKGTP